jgi:hypothetical protein
LALTSPTSSSRLVGIVRSQTQAMEFFQLSIYLLLFFFCNLAVFPVYAKSEHKYIHPYGYVIDMILISEEGKGSIVEE